jgi:hypothetical protein
MASRTGRIHRSSDAIEKMSQAEFAEVVATRPTSWYGEAMPRGAKGWLSRECWSNLPHHAQACYSVVVAVERLTEDGGRDPHA